MNYLKLPLLSGVLLSLTLPPFNQTWLIFFALIPFFVFLKGKNTPKQLFFGSALTGMLYTGTSLFPLLSVQVWWWLDTQSIFFEYRFWFIAIFLFLLAFVTGPAFFAIFAFGVRWYERFQNWFLGKHPQLGSFGELIFVDKVIVVAFFWIFLEWVRRICLGGLMWQELAISWYRYDWTRELFSFTGMVGGGLLIIVSNFIIAEFLLAILGRDENDWLKFRKAKFSFGVLLLACFLVIGSRFGFSFLGDKNGSAERREGQIKLVSINAPGDLDGSYGLTGYNFYYSALKKALGNSPDIVVLPENAIPFLVYDEERATVIGDEDVEKLFSNLLVATEANATTSVIIGVHTVKGDDRFNASLLIQNGKVLDIYHKRSLLPLSELTPNMGLLKPVAVLAKGKRDKSVFDHGKLQPLLCSEVFYRNTYLKGGGEKILAVVSGNDSVFGSPLVSARMRAIAQLRVIEQDLKGLIIATKGERGVFINSHGEVVALGDTEGDVLEASVSW